MTSYRVVKMLRHAWAHTNMVYVPDTFKGVYCAVKGYAFKVQRCSEVSFGTVSLSQVQREILEAKEGDALEILPIGISSRSVLSKVVVSLSVKSKESHVKISQEKVKRTFSEVLDGVPLTEGQQIYLVLPLEGEDPDKKVLFMGTVEQVETVDKEIIGVVRPNTSLSIKNHSGITVLGMTAELNITGEFDFKSLEIGGLRKEFGEMFRRAFIQRTYPPEFIQKMGITHIKGIMLYGPPGTGKTLIARKMSSLLNSAPPKIVNGPEILNKYVGQSEENIRKLFEDAENDYKKYGEKSPLHVIIFDEIDAICKSRGSSNGVGDQVVNQLLSKIDGVECLNNILVIGMTNRIDLIDDALLRPGRFEIHIEITLPDEGGRLEILRIHTSRMEKNCFLGADVEMPGIAAKTKNYTGAEITALVKSAASFALERAKKNKEEVVIGMQDFEKAMRETVPAFGVSLSLRVPEPFYMYPSARTVLDIGNELVRKILHNGAKGSKTISLLLSGVPGVGKSSLAEAIALYSGIPFIRIISPKDLVGKEENEKVNYLKRTFKDAYRSSEALVLLDDIEGLMDYVAIGPRFLTAVLQAIKIFVKNEDKGRILVLATTADPILMEESGILGSFDEHVEVPLLTQGDKEWFDHNTEVSAKIGKTIKEVIQ
ncbi:vesicle-fusing ATPase [Nematocida sp. LUAm3]|nr:vesicle-fusing ATPase [Nematocida sp. LUAm3]KAI5174017.1 vesicle-fusing ATPase [Nematocida sp. LUAm2]KAI5177240.1 vesicle-fusing ATPase [Nematocida sp. LUAm1]